MNKKFLSSYLPFLFSLTFFFTVYAVCQIFRYGLSQGLILTALAWSLYVLCVPAAHGRVLIGAPIKVLLKKTFFPEPYLWFICAVLNIFTMIFSRPLYLKTLPTYLLYRVLTVPSYWIILIIAFIGTWYRVICGAQRYLAHEAKHTIIRHIITMLGVSALFYLTNYDLIVMINLMAGG